jgi:hypothetical protein
MPGMRKVALRRAAPWIAVVAVLAVLGAGLVIESHREASDPGDSDAIAFASGAQLVIANPQHLYDPAAQRRVEGDLLNIPRGTAFIDPFTNIAAGALVLSPLAHVDLWTASEIEVVISVLLMAGAFLLMLQLLSPLTSRPLRVLIATSAVISVPAVSAVIQWDSLMTVALLGSVLLVQRRHPEWAGVLLATLVLKPQVVWLVIPALVAARSWRYLAGLLAGAAAWIGVSLFVAGPQAMVALGRLIAQSYPAQADNSVGLPSLVSALTGNGALGFVAAAGFGVLATAMLLWKRDLFRDQPVAAVSLGIVLSLLCAPHVNAEDLMLVALPLALLARTRPLLALVESLAFSLAALVQLQLPVGDRHLEPFVLVARAVSLLLTHRAPHKDVAANRSRVPRLRVAHAHEPG